MGTEKVSYEVTWKVVQHFTYHVDAAEVAKEGCTLRDVAGWACETDADSGTTYTKLAVQAFDREGAPVGRKQYFAQDDC